MLVPDLPLPDRRQAGIENCRQDSLADSVPLAQSANRLRGICGNRNQTEGVVILHSALGNEADRMEITRGLMDRVENAAGFFGLGHSKSPNQKGISPSVAVCWSPTDRRWRDAAGGRVGVPGSAGVPPAGSRRTERAGEDAGAPRETFRRYVDAYGIRLPASGTRNFASA